MNVQQDSLSKPRELGRLLVVYWPRWAVVTVIAAAAAVAYAQLAPKTWQATQALIVRNEAVGSDSDAAKLHASDDLKATQETIMELAKSHSLLKAALAEVGPPPDCRAPAAWPTDKDVEDFKKDVKIAPPKGVEFGTTEVFYLEVQSKERTRAAALNAALSRQLQLDLQDLRNARAQSMIDELNKAVQVAQADLQTATQNLTTLEKDVGSDLPELRSMLDANSADTSLRRTVSEIETELRQFQGTEKANRQLLALLQEAQADPNRLIAAPSRLLDSQPALRRLKDGLVDAQLHTATLSGRMSAEHPEVLAAKEAEAQVAARLRAELSAAIRGLQSELAFDTNRLEMLSGQRAGAAARLATLAGLRATYTNVLGEAGNRAKLLDRAEQNLTAARSEWASSKAASLIARVDAPDTGTSPISPSGAVVVLGGALGGLLTGFGLVLLTAPAGFETNSSSARQKSPTASSEAAEPANVPVAALAQYPSPKSRHEASSATQDSDWLWPATAPGNMNCKRALKVLNEQGRRSRAAV
jgi:polysaccharide biosynthesis transport protein